MEPTTTLRHAADPPPTTEGTVAPEPAAPATTRAARPIETVKNWL
ncbi:hypothetical protein HEK616_45990 [Streptomyces nigrescens]|uniref:Uncharacterized protein n=2 Tax=Streptomyces TaxID=1883 RepID=A0ABM7ZXL4_STRNI|nr:hypothetical protein [Streptomyces nigrescens]MEE4425209.1 hypothetical protein [Streptomyces sp. DSM 41528]BDM71112.1 hypothetical protein HEK616_45990 [Streptomyces nigrescens]